MTKKVSKKDEKKSSKRELRKTIEIKLEAALSDLKSDVDQKKFKHLIKKAGKLFSTVVSRRVKPIVKKKAVTAKAPTKKVAKPKEQELSKEKV